MNLREGADIYTADGDKVGSLDRVVLDPRSKQVTHVVVRKGFLFGEDKVVPVSLLGATSDGDRITLRPDAGDLEQLPNFEESHYVSPGVEPAPGAYDRPPLYWYPPLGSAAWSAPAPGVADYPAVQYIRETERNIPEGTVALKRGARVLANDDEIVGSVSEVLTEPAADRVTHLVIAHGLIVQDHRLIPTTWITSVLEDEILLAVPSDVVKRLPTYDRQN